MLYKKYHLKVKFVTEVLGTQSTRQVATEFIAARNGFELPQDEAESLPDALERGMTVFHKDPKTGAPMIWDYQVMGFLRNSAKVQNGQVSGKVKNLRSKVTDLVFVQPRYIRLVLPEGEGLDTKERPARVETQQGPRTTVLISEMAPAGTVFYCDIVVGGEKGELTEEVLRELLDYGRFKGFLQWRNGGYGRFEYELEAEEDE